MLLKLLRRFSRLDRIFLLTVVLPTGFAGLYFGLISSDVFVSESRFVVRSAQRATPAMLGGVLQSVGLSRSSDDTFAVHDFMQSRDALEALERKTALSRLFSDSKVDVLSRFAALDGDTSFEALHRYYQRRVNVSVDGISAISVLKTSAFSADVAKGMNEDLLILSEQLINQLNERSRQDTIQFVASELDAAGKKARSATAALAAFRSANGVFDPDRQSALQLQMVAKLQDELIATKTQLEQVQQLTRDNPQIQSLQRRVDTLQREINNETTKVTGAGASLSSKAATFSMLELDRALADRQFAAALAAMEQARNDALRKQIYLERVVQPSLPDAAVEPRRWRNVIATFLLGMVAWGIGSLLLAGIREHHD